MNASPVQGSKSPMSPSVENDKSKKYDRQLRLWGDHGQSAIESARVCLINATATGTEILKSLVLPGLGSFTIIDGHKITGEDIGNNFFLEANSVGASRAKEATASLLEMNRDVRGDYVDETIENVIETNPELLKNFSLVIATGVSDEKTLIKLSQLTWDAKIPLIVCKAVGFIGYIRLQINEHCVIESHPDSNLEDLRLDEPFPELRSHLQSFDLESMSRKDLSHTPYLIVIYKFLKEWQQANSKVDNQLPANYKEKNQLRDLIKGAKNKFIDRFAKVEGEEESRDLDLANFDEAIKAVNNVLIDSKKIPSETRNIINSAQKITVTNDNENPSSNSKFWLLVTALRDYIESIGSLPLRGTLPDMTSDSTRYIQLQKIYSQKAKDDIEVFSNHLNSVQNGSGLREEPFTEADLKLFCKNAHFLNLVRTSPLFSEFGSDSSPVSSKLRDRIATEDLNCDSESNLIYYLMFRASDKFYSQYNRSPGESDDQVDGDVVRFKTIFKDLAVELGANQPVSKDDYIQEMVRFGGSELHSVAAFIGGTAAHEAIKLITGQYVPFNNTFIYNAINSTTATFDL